MAKLLLAAGGTGGHMFPAQALAEIMIKRGWSVAMITDIRGRKHTTHIPADPILDVPGATLSPRRPIKAAIGMVRLMQGVSEAKAFIRKWQPDVVAGFGGYPAFPTMRAARRLGIPIIIHEQNAVLGRVNRIFARSAQIVASGFEDLERCPIDTNHQMTGNPLRAQIIAAAPTQYIMSKRRLNLLITGGSLGARLLSETVPKAIADLPQALRKRLNIVQQTRAESLEIAQKVYAEAGVKAHCAPFFNDIETHLAKSHYIISRAGASSVSEIAIMGKPSLLVPLAIAMDDHQMANARSLERLNAADILPESEFTPETVKTTLERRLNDSTWLEHAAAAARSTARPHAATELADLVSDAAR